MALDIAKKWTKHSIQTSIVKVTEILLQSRYTWKHLPKWDLITGQSQNTCKKISGSSEQHQHLDKCERSCVIFEEENKIYGEF